MVVALNPDSAFPYVLERERDAPGATMWQIKLLTGREFDLVMRQAQASGMDSGELKGEVAADIDTVLRLVLRGWANYRDHNGAEIPFPGVAEDTAWGTRCLMARPSVLDRLPLSVQDRTELMRAALSGSTLGVDDSKKSSLPQP